MHTLVGLEDDRCLGIVSQATEVLGNFHMGSNSPSASPLAAAMSPLHQESLSQCVLNALVVVFVLFQNQLKDLSPNVASSEFLATMFQLLPNLLNCSHQGSLDRSRTHTPHTHTHPPCFH